MKRVPDKSQSLAFTASPRRSLRHPSPTTSSSPSRASFTDEIASFSASGWQRGREKSSLTTRRGSSQRLVSKARLSGNPRARLCLLQRDGGELPQSHDLRASYVFLSRTYVYTRRLRRVYVCVRARARVYIPLLRSCAHKSPRSGVARTENVNLPSGRSACAIRADASYRRSPPRRLPPFIFPSFRRSVHGNEFKNWLADLMLGGQSDRFGNPRLSLSQLFLLGSCGKLDCSDLYQEHAGIYGENCCYTYFGAFDP